jgi:Uma2 family endonuclease
MVTKIDPMTAEAFLKVYGDQRFELINGEAVEMAPSKSLHGIVVNLIAFHLTQHIMANNLGYGFGAETGFLIKRDPDSLLAPDFAFVVHDQMPQPIPDEFPDFAPRLVIEVVSPSNTAAEILQKVTLFLEAGSRLVWVVYPIQKKVVVHRPGGEATTLGIDDSLSGEDVFPGFSMDIAKIFPNETTT